MRKITAEMLKSLISTSSKCTGAKFDTVVVGTDQRAQEVLAALHELGLDYHVIADDELRPQTILVTSQEALGKLPGGGRN